MRRFPRFLFVLQGFLLPPGTMKAVVPQPSAHTETLRTLQEDSQKEVNGLIRFMTNLETLLETGQRVGLEMEKLPSPDSCPPLDLGLEGAAAGVRMTNSPRKGLEIGKAKGGGRGPREGAAADPL